MSLLNLKMSQTDLKNAQNIVTLQIAQLYTKFNINNGLWQISLAKQI